MASGTITYNSSYVNTHVQLVWSATLNPSAFTSTVSYQLQVRQTESTTSDWYTRFTGSLLFLNNDTGETITSKTIDTGSKHLVINNSWLTMTSGSFTVSHNSAGVAPTILVGGTLTNLNNMSYAPGSDAYITLDVIAVSAKITSAPNFTDDENPTITYSNPMGSYVTSLQACISNVSGSSIYVGYRNISKTGTSYTFNLTDSERSALRAAAADSTTLSVRFYVKSVIDGVTYHSYSSTRTMTINADAPVLTVSAIDNNATTAALTGSSSSKMIRGYSSIKCTLSASASKGATITSTSITCGSDTRNNVSSATFGSANVNKFVFKATDSRGYTSTKTITFTMVDYIKVSCNQQIIAVMEDNNTTQAIVTITGNFFKGSFGAKSNTLKLYMRHTQSDGSMGDWNDLSPLGYTVNGDTYELSFNVSGLDASGSYVFQCKAVDALNSATTNEYTMKLLPVFDWGKTDFNFNVPVSLNDKTVLRHNASANNVVLSASGGFIYLRPGGTNTTSGEVKISPQGNIELTGDIIINGKSLKSLLNIT